MLNKIFNHKRIKPKPSMKNKKHITNDDKAFLEYLQGTNYTCLVCSIGNGIEWHHVKKNSISKKQHNRLIPLCVNHHRYCTEISAHNAPKNFRKEYPIEAQMVVAKDIYNRYLAEISV